MQITLDISAKRIADLLTTCAESSAVTYWCSAMKPAPRSTFEKRVAKAKWWYAEADAFDSFLVDVTEQNADGEGNDEVHRVNSARLRAGLKLMAEKHGRHFGDFLNESDDMTKYLAGGFAQTRTRR